MINPELLNKCHHANCLFFMHDHIPDGSIHLTVTSPPYDDLRKYKGFKFPFEHIARHLYRVTADGGVVVWVVSDQTVNGSESGSSFRQALFFKSLGFRLHDTMIYQTDKMPLNQNRYEQDFEYMFVFSKGKPRIFNPIRIPCINQEKRNGQKRNIDKDEPGKRVQKLMRRDTKPTKIKGNIWKFFTGFGKSTRDVISFKHPATFPEQLAADHIKSWSNEGDIVFDPFAGSGTTPKMAHLLKRQWIACDIAEAYIKITDTRLKPYLQQKTLF